MLLADCLGKRILYDVRYSEYGIDEATVVEISPNKEYARLRHPNGNFTWERIETWNGKHHVVDTLIIKNGALSIQKIMHVMRTGKPLKEKK